MQAIWEGQLLGFPVLALVGAAILFALTGLAPFSEVLWPALLLALAFYGAQFALQGMGYKGERLLFPLSAMLSTLGLILVFRLEPALALRQYIWLLLGLAAMLLMARLFRDYLILEQYRYTYLALGLAFLGITLLVGTEAGGARSWLVLGPFSFQPAEAVKLLLVLFLASYLNEKRELLGGVPGMGSRLVVLPPARVLAPLAATGSLFLLLLVLQNDLGTALIFFAAALVMLYVATGRGTYMGGGLLFFLGGAALAYRFFYHVQVRVDVWLNPWREAQGAGFQVIQALLALGSGGVVGTGLGLGAPQTIPAAATDFIFAVAAEEMGLAGGLGVLITYMLLATCGFRVALRARHDFGLLLAAGITSLFALQALIIIAGVTKLLPLTGITLPFMSYGGSSLVVNYALLGLLLAVGRDVVTE